MTPRGRSSDVSYTGRGRKVEPEEAIEAMVGARIVAMSADTWLVWRLEDGRQVEYCCGAPDYPDTWKIVEAHDAL